MKINSFISLLAMLCLAPSVMAFEARFSSLYIRGSQNGWAAEPMALVADHLWSGEVVFPAGQKNCFKFDVAADWKVNFGDNPVELTGQLPDYVADLGGKDICTEAVGRTRILFSDQDQSYYYFPAPGSSSETQPFIGPYLTFSCGGPVHECLTVSFETISARQTTVTYWRDGQPPMVARESTAGLIHHLSLPGLVPGERYAYQLSGLEGQTHSKIHTLRAPREGGSRLRFVVAGDMQDVGAGQKWLEVAGSIQRVEDLDMILATGDLVMASHRGEWKMFFDKGADLLSRIPMVSAVGNHDTRATTDQALQRTFRIMRDSDSNPFDGATDFMRYFPFPREREQWGETDGTFYTVSYGPARFIVLNTEVLLYHTLHKSDYTQLHTMANFAQFAQSPDVPLAHQWEWLLGQLEAYKQQRKPDDFLFVAMHIPPYNASTGHGREQFAARNGFSHAVDGTADWVFYGHEHMYQRYLPLLTDEQGTPHLQTRYGTEGGAGTGYLLVPPAGNFPREYAKFLYYDESFPPMLAYPPASNLVAAQGFVLVTIDSPRIKIQPFDQNGTPIEEGVAYQKSGT